MLAEVQARFRQALGAPDASAALPLIAGVPDAAQRLEIYRRHHRESLVRHLRRRFPTIEWLVGSEPMTRLAQGFIAAHAPGAPCMAEYGGAFVEFIGSAPEADRHRYLQAVAEIEWMLGEVAVAVDTAPLPVAALASFPPERLADLVLHLQPGTRYLGAAWPVDELVRMRLSARLPEHYVLAAEPVQLEITGARGAFSISRLDAGAFAFRRSIATGAPIGAAVDAAMTRDPRFDPGAGLTSLFGARLVTAVTDKQRDTP